MSLPPVWVLTCEELPERAAAVKAHLAERGLAGVTFFRGVHGVTWGLETSREYEPGKRLPPGHVALNLGSYMMWQTAERYAESPSLGDYGFAKGPKDPILFFEDDVLLPPDFEAQYDRVIAELETHNPDWDLVLIGLCESEPRVWHKVTERLGVGDSSLCRMGDPFGTHAMLVRRRAIPVLLEHMRKAERNLDQQLYKYVLRPGLLNWCAVLPTIVRQRTYDYGDGGKPEWAPSTLRPGDEEKETPAEAVGGPPSPELYAATLEAVTPYSCIYRGEPLLEHGRRIDRKGTVPLTVCAYLDAACHQRPFDAVTAAGAAATRCDTCAVRTAMAPKAERPRLPLPDGHFNPSMARWGDKLILATRDSWGHSKVALWELTNAAEDWTGAWDCRPIGSYASKHPDAPRLEDPRLFVAPHRETREPRLHAAFNLPDGYPPKLVQVGYACFAKDLSGIEYTEVMRSPYSNAYEKNWMPVADWGENEIRWAYSFKPNHFVMGATQNWSTPNPLPWTGGVIRGGASPVFVPDYRFQIANVNNRYPFGCDFPATRSPNGPDTGVYYHFFHGCLKRIEGSVYTMGCNVFEAKPPYRVLRQTKLPLLWPDLPAAGENIVKRYVVFPGGAVPHAGAWHICSGIDDTFCRIDRLPFADVEAALTDVPEGDATVSIRETQIATGVKRVAP